MYFSHDGCNIYFGLTTGEITFQGCVSVDLAYGFDEELALTLPFSWIALEKSGQDWFSMFC